ncbi:hypothetical protein QWY31_01440 [Cytophagales bacterium LB-30]|uniref:Uncharacterized protein n=1 Tax=Shiella aurantiaca TaxID=3058365 RepID=A0ABT8F127_9BACT|nr:hypothetical protein [Shiella aurantiaca]MDN4164140.1 hypothetical protein [Shiella aurantiaca]
MEKLDHDWITQGIVDFEYKKYVLLAYLQRVKARFDGKCLYPFIADLHFHYQNLLHIKQSKTLLYEDFPQKITRADFEKLQFTYQKLVQDDVLMEEIESILTYAQAQMAPVLEKGKELHQHVEEALEIFPVGLNALYNQEGYVLIDNAAHSVQVYRYQVSLFQGAQDTFRGLHTTFIEEVRRSISRTYEQIKAQLVRQFTDMPHPATYVIRARHPYPYEETIFPMAKRLLVRYVSVRA